MFILQRISDQATISSWPTLPGAFHCPLGEVNGATAGWESGDYRLIEVADPAPSEADLLAHAATKRWQIETGGITVADTPVPTDARTQAVLTAAFVKASADANYQIAPWKVAPGVYATLSAAQIIAFADAVEAHVQACFAANEAVDAKIIDGTYTSFADIDTAAEWPV